MLMLLLFEFIMIFIVVMLLSCYNRLNYVKLKYALTNCLKDRSKLVQFEEGKLQFKKSMKQEEIWRTLVDFIKNIDPDNV